MFNTTDIKGAFTPLQDWVILKRVKEEVDKTKKVGGILLPDSSYEKQAKYGKCLVVAVGKGRTTILGVLIPCEVKQGDVVMLQGFVEGEYKFRLNGEDVYAIRERHLNVLWDEPKPPKKKK